MSFAPLNASQLRAFTAVATHGGFSAAARVLGVTQPALTHQVRALETKHGVTLFLRQGRRVVVTPLGEELLRVARRINTMEEEAQALLGAAGDLKHGALRIGADGPFHVMPVLARLQQTYPGLTLSVRVGNSEDVERRLLDVQSDVAILAHSSDDERLYARRIARHPVVVFVPKKHAWAKLGRIKLDALSGEPMVVREAGSATRRMFDALMKRRNVTPNIVLEIESREAMREAVAAGFGFGVVSAPELGSDDRLASVEISDGTVFTEEHAVCLHDRRQDKAIKAFFAASLHSS